MNDSYQTTISAGVHLKNSAEVLVVRQQIGYALPVVGTTLLLSPIALLQGIYATYFGVSLTAIAMVLLVARLFDAVTDPLVGYLSDRYHARKGSRKVFIASGAMLIIFSGYFLYVPVDPNVIDSSTQVSVMYFLTFYLLFYLSMTIFEIPHLAWSTELASTPAERNSLFSWRVAAASMGAWLFYAVPLLPVFETNEITPQTLQWTVLASAFLILPALLISLKVVPNRRGIKNRGHNHKKNTVPLSLRMLATNRPLLIFLVVALITGMSNGMFWSMSFIYVNSYLGMGEHYALATLAQLIVGTLSIRLWYLVATRLNKRVAWALGVGIFLMGVAALAVLKPGEASLQQLLLINILAGCGLTASSITAPSILSDVIDYSHYKFNTDCSASFFAIFLLITKASMALGGALALLTAGWYGFDPSSSESHSPDAITGLRLAAIWLPVLIGMLSIACILLLPNIERHHNTIRRYLERKSIRKNSMNNTSDATEKLSTETLLNH